MTRDEVEKIAFKAKWVLSDMKEIICAWHMEDLERWMYGGLSATVEEFRALADEEEKRLDIVEVILPEIEVRTRRLRIDLLRAIEK